MRARMFGFTLIELMVTLAVVAVLLIAAIPSFVEFRQRTTLQSAADQIVSVWGNARFEALRRNEMLKVTLLNDAGAMCMGVATTTDPDDEDTCDCFDIEPPLDCNVSVFPTSQAEWRGVTATGVPSLGGDSGVAVIDPKRGGLTDSADWGGVTLKGPPGRANYQLGVYIDRRGRAVVCEPAGVADHIPAYASRQCVL